MKWKNLEDYEFEGPTAGVYPCGTRQHYQQGCRDDRCRAANALYPEEEA